MDNGELHRREVAAVIWKGGGELSLSLDLEGIGIGSVGGSGGGEEMRTREEERGSGSMGASRKEAGDGEEVAAVAARR